MGVGGGLELGGKEGTGTFVSTAVSESTVSAATRMRPAAESLSRVRRRARFWLVLRGTSFVLSIAVMAVLVVGLLDYLVRAPSLLRGVLLLTGLAGLAWLVWRHVAPAVRFRPSLTELALRLEATELGREVGLPGRLASALELADSDQATGPAGALIRDLTADVDARLKRLGPVTALVNPRNALHSLGVLALAAAPMVALAVLSPSSASIGAQRLFAPWSDAAWPRRFAVADATSTAVHPVTAALPLRAVLTRTPNAPGKSDVAVVYRLIRDGQAGETRRALLTAQSRASSGEVMEGVRGELYERLLEPAALGAGAGDVELEIEYAFEAGDDRTPTHRVVLVQPPFVTEATALVELPEYAGAVQGTDSPLVAGRRSLGAGIDSRATVGPILAGSRVTLRLSLNKPVPGPKGSEAEFIAAVFPEASFGEDMTARFDAAEWTLSWTIESSARVAVSPVDRYGIASGAECVYRFDVVADQPPTATMLAPAQDETVLATALIDVLGEGRDDVALAWLKVQFQRFSPQAGSASRAVEPAGEPLDLAGGDVRAGARQAMRAALLDLAPLGLRPGDEVWLTALSADGFVVNGAARDPVRSAPRRLRVITESEFIEQVRSELAALREAAIRLDQDARAAAELTRGGTPEQLREAERRQNVLSERLTPPRELLRRLANRIDRNNLSDPSLASLLEDAGETVQRAAEASHRAEESLEQAVQSAAAGEREQSERQAFNAQRSQDRVRSELQRLIEMLGQGQDAWAARRQVERLLDEQRRLAEQTEEAGRETTGRAPEDLTAEQRERLEQLAQQQRELSQRVEAAIDNLAQQGRQLEQSNPAQARAMQDAAQRGRQSQIPDRQQQAGEEIDRNRTQRANELQQQAMRDMERMLRELEQAERRREEALRRMLLELTVALADLVERQQGELDALVRRTPTGDFGGLDAGMISLHRATLSVLEKVRGERSLRRVLELLTPAAAAQAEAVVALRAVPADGPRADEQERTSLKLLTEALAEARRLETEAEERSQQRQREELRDAYTKVLGRQLEVRDQASRFLGREITRRDRPALARLGEEQEAIRVELEEVRAGASELADAGVFLFAHRRLDRAAEVAAETLSAAGPVERARREQTTVVRVLEGLIEALNDAANQSRDDFQDGESGGGGQQGEGERDPLIPPAQEIKLLRAMQQELVERTRALAGEARRSDAELDETAQLQGELAEQSRQLIERLNSRRRGGDGPRNEGGEKP